MGSVRFDGVRFVAYPQDHSPAHVHGFYAETEAVVELRIAFGREVLLPDRIDAVRPGNAKRSDVRRVLEAAAAHFDELFELWRQAHA
jgi:hypothetical protein